MKSDVAYVKSKNLLGDIRLAGLSIVFLFSSFDSRARQKC